MDVVPKSFELVWLDLWIWIWISERKDWKFVSGGMGKRSSAGVAESKWLYLFMFCIKMSKNYTQYQHLKDSNLCIYLRTRGGGNLERLLNTSLVDVSKDQQCPMNIHLHIYEHKLDKTYCSVFQVYRECDEVFQGSRM